MADILKPEQVAKRLGFNDMAKFRRQFGDLITVVSGQELMDKELVSARLNELVDPSSDTSIDLRNKRKRKSSGENLGLVLSQITRLQKSIRKKEPEVNEAREKAERTGKRGDHLQYLLLNKSLMENQSSLINAQKEYDRIIEERIDEIENPDETDQK